MFVLLLFLLSIHIVVPEKLILKLEGDIHFDDAIRNFPLRTYQKSFGDIELPTKKDKDKQEKFFLHKTSKKKLRADNITDVRENGQNITVDKDIKDFLQHVLRQSLHVIQEAPEKIDVNSDTRIKLAGISKQFKDKFKQYINETYRAVLKTDEGRNKVIINTIEMAHYLMKRFASNLNTESRTKNKNISNYLNAETDKNTKLEFEHVCKKFSVCRTGNGMCGFLSQFFSEILLCNDDKFIEANNALTEVLQYADHSKVLTAEQMKSFKITIIGMESLNLASLKHLYMVLNNMLMKKNQPLRVPKENNNLRVVNASVAFLDALDYFCKSVPEDERNKKSWDNINRGIRNFRLQQGQHTVLNIMRDFNSHLLQVENDMDFDTLIKLREKITVFYQAVGSSPVP